MRAYTALLEKTGEDKYRRIPATVLTDITADEAHEIVVDSNYVQRVLTPSEKARSISRSTRWPGAKNAAGTVHGNLGMSRLEKNIIYPAVRLHDMFG